MPLLILALILLAPDITNADCRPGEVPASAADFTKMREVGFPETYIKEGACWPRDNPASALSALDAAAKETLDTMWCGGKAASCGNFRSNIQQVDPNFARCAVRFLEEVRRKDPTICINSAYRSPEHQQFLCGGGCGPKPNPCATRSQHTAGKALDISNGDLKSGRTNVLPAWIRNKAKDGFGVSFPLANDSVHMEPSGTNCATAGFNAGGDSDSAPVAQPMTPLGQAMQGALCFISPQAAQCRGGMTPQQMPLQQYPQQYAQPSTAQPNNAFTQTPTTQPVSNTINTGSVTPSTNSDDGSLVSDFIDTTSTSSPCKQTSNAANDLLQALADPSKKTPCASPVSSTTSSTTILIRNNSNLKDAQTIRPMATSGGTVIRYLNGGGGVYQLTPDKGNTFVSDDLRNTKSYIAPATTQSSTAQVLSTLQNILSRLAVILTPFGGRIPQRAE